jgi:sulfatase maturation enzyme AslB (radical SAM superfamily)
MSLIEWFNSEPARHFRKSLLLDTPTDVCSRCYYEEKVGHVGRRQRSNQKSVIFTKTAFQNSFKQSPGYNHFKLSEQDGFADTLPIDLHIDLGNYCNLACKMCWSEASSRIATQYVRWGFEEHRKFLGTDWTKDSATWTKLLNELVTIPKLKNIHFMGGETLLTNRFEEFVDFMILHKKFDLCFSFVTNGTTFNESLINKLKKFARVGIEVSIETVTKHNDYVRQGTDTGEVLKNIQRYKQHCDNSNISVTLRPAISALTVGYYYTLLEYCLENQFLIKSLLVTSPGYLNVGVLPASIRNNYKQQYQKLLIDLTDVNINTEYNESDANNYRRSIRSQVEQTLSLLDSTVDQQEKLFADMVAMCKKWDSELGFDALNLYPELAEDFKKYGY